MGNGSSIKNRELRFEARLRETLESVENIDGSVYYRRYLTAKDRLTAHIYPMIARVHDEFTDHGLPHVNDVLSKAYQLIAHDDEHFHGLELYFLGISILFHDAGMVYAREGHEKIVEVYRDFRVDQYDDYEESIVLDIVGAHTGRAPDGTVDTLNYVGNDLVYKGNEIKAQEIAAVLRFADELSEGPFRTLPYAVRNNMFDIENRIHHRYASTTEIYINTGSNKINLDCLIQLQNYTQEATGAIDENELREFLRYVYDRIRKLNGERKYNKHYTRVLEPFKSTEAAFLFRRDAVKYDLGLTKIVLDDKVIPGDADEEIWVANPDYELRILIRKISDACRRKPPISFWRRLLCR